MKPWQLDRRVNSLSEKLTPVTSDVVRLDFGSFSEPEKQLFTKLREIQNEYGPDLPADVMEANREFIFKTSEVLSWRVLELFMFVMKHMFAGDEIEEWYFKLHFYNFFEDLKDCLENVRKWPEKERKAFLRDMKPNSGLNKVFRIPRDHGIKDLKKRKNKKSEDNG